MKGKMKRTFLLAVVNVFLCTVCLINLFVVTKVLAFDSDVSGVLVDINKNYKELIAEDLASKNKYPNLTANSNPFVFIYHIGNHLIYSDLDGSNNRVLYSYNLETKKNENLLNNIKDIHGNSAVINVVNVKPYSKGKLLVKLSVAENNIEEMYFVTDGTLSGTSEWNDNFGVESEGYTKASLFNSFKWKSSVGIYYSIDNELLLKGSSSEGVISDNFTYSEIMYYEVGGILYFLPDSYPGHKDIALDKNIYSNVITKKEHFFISGTEQLSSFSLDLGYQDHFLRTDIPVCRDNDSPVLLPSATNITRNGDELFFFSGNSDNVCIYAFNTKTKGFRVSNLNYINDAPILNLEILGVGKAGVVIKSVKDKYHKPFSEIFKVDLSLQKKTSLYEREDPFELSIMPIMNDGETYYYYQYNEVSENNKLVKLNINDFTYEILGHRLGVADEYTSNEFSLSFVNSRFTSKRIIGGELYFVYSLPYPGLYRFNSKLKRVEKVTFADGFGFNESADVLSANAVNNGWLILQKNNNHLNSQMGQYNYEVNFVDYNGIVKHISPIDIASVIDNPLVFKDNNKLYVTSGFDLYRIDFEKFKLIKVATGERNQKIYKFRAVKDSYAFAESDSHPKEFIKISIINDQTVGVNSGEEGVLKSCGDTFVLYDNSNLKVIKGNSFEVIVNELPFNISFDAASIGFIYYIKDNAVYRYDCNKNSEPKLIHSNQGERNFRFFSNSFNNKTNEFHYSLDAPNGDWYQEVYTVSLADEVSLIPAKNISTPMLNFNKAYGINSLYIIDNLTIGSLRSGYYSEIDTSKLDEISKYPGRKSFLLAGSSEDQRYIFGTATFTYTEAYRGRVRYLFLIDSLNQDIYFFSSGLYNTILSSVDGKLLLSIFNLSTTLSAELKIVDIECIVNAQCEHDRNNRQPVVSNGAELFFSDGDIINFQFRAHDEDKDILNYQLLNAPSWLSIDNDGVVFGIIPNGLSGVLSPISIQVSDGIETVNSTPFIFHIIPRNRAPMWLPNTAFSADFGAGIWSFEAGITSELDLNNIFSDIERDGILYSINSNVAGISVNSDGVLSVNVAQPGTYVLTITAKDPQGASSDSMVMLNIYKNDPVTPRPEPEEGGESGGVINLFSMLSLLMFIVMRRKRFTLCW